MDTRLEFREWIWNNILDEAPPELAGLDMFGRSLIKHSGIKHSKPTLIKKGEIIAKVLKRRKNPINLNFVKP